MRYIKLLISAVLLVAMISSSIGAVFAPSFSGYLSVEFDQTTASIGDTVTMTVTASNEGLDSWCPVKIYAPIPSGMQYVSHIVPDKTLQNYNPSSGIWDVNRMRHDERGHLKTLIITLKVLPEAAGERLTGSATFDTLMIEETGENLVAAGLPPVRKTIVTIEPEEENEEEEYGNGNGNGSGSGNGTGNGTGSGSGTGAGSGSSTGFDVATFSGLVKNSNLIYNSTGLGAGPSTLDLQSGGGGGNGKTYEVFNSTLDSETDPKDLVYGFAALLLVALIILGYLYGTKMKP